MEPKFKIPDTIMCGMHNDCIMEERTIRQCESRIASRKIGEWAKGKTYLEEELNALNDCCKWLQQEKQRKER